MSVKRLHGNSSSETPEREENPLSHKVLLLRPDPSHDDKTIKNLKTIDSIQRMIMDHCNQTGKFLITISTESPESSPENRTILQKFEIEIMEARVVIIVLTGLRPVVMWEAGYALSLKKPILYLIDENEADSIIKTAYISGFPIIRYNSSSYYDTIKDKLFPQIMNLFQESQLPKDAIEAMVNFQEKVTKNLRYGNDLYGRCQLRDLKTTLRRIIDWTNDGPFRVEGSQQVRVVGKYIIDNLQIGGFATMYYSKASAWEPDDDKNSNDEYLQATAERLKKNPDLQIMRVYILDTHTQIDEDAFRKLTEEDSKAGVQVRYLILSENERSEHGGVEDFAIWDNEIYAQITYGNTDSGSPRIHQCEYYRKGSQFAHKAEEHREWILELQDRLRPCPSIPTERSLLLHSYLDHQHSASELCKQQNPSCKHMHANWPLLKIFHLVANPGWHREFYYSALDHITLSMDKACNESKKFKVLLCGPADFGLLYHFIEAVGLERARFCEITVLDRCEAPLRSCKWFNERLHQNSKESLRLLLEHKDIFKFQNVPNEGFDLIMSDGFLNSVITPISETSVDKLTIIEKLLHHWLSLLRTGGRLLTTARVHKTQGQDIVMTGKLEEEVLANFRTHTWANYEIYSRSLNNLPNREAVIEAATAYAQSLQDTPIPDREYLESLASKLTHDLSNGESDIRIVELPNEYEFSEKPIWALINIAKKVPC